MSTLEESFEKLIGRQPTEKDKQDLYRVRDGLGLRNNDAMWMVLMALGHYETQYRKVPALIAEATKEAVGNARGAAEAEVRAAAAQATAQLTRTVSETARHIAEHNANAKRWQWIVGCVVGSALALVLVGAWAFHAGRMTGDAEGSERANATVRAREAGKSWTSTQEGQLAIGLTNAGSLRELATCSDPGWVRQGDRCRPRCGKGFAPGWNVSENTRAGR